MLSLQQVHPALHCCIALYRIALHRSLCTALYSTSLFCTALYCIRLHCTFHCSHLSGVRALARVLFMFLFIVPTLTPFPSFTPFLHSFPFHPLRLFCFPPSFSPSLLVSFPPSRPSPQSFSRPTPSCSPSLLLSLYLPSLSSFRSKSKGRYAKRTSKRK